jgi:trehalose 6-phosphate phosphatase
VRDALKHLAGRYRLVAIVTGRRSEDAAALLDAPGISIYGLYGFEDAAPELVTAVVPLVRTAAGKVPEARVEDKGASIAVHYRQAPDPQAARVDLVVALQPIASQCGLELVEGKMVLELVPSGRPMKGGVVERLVGEHGLEAILFAGDDRADLDAFEALDRLSGSGVTVIRVAVRGEETPQALIDAADVTVEGPSGLVQFLRSL